MTAGRAKYRSFNHTWTCNGSSNGAILYSGKEPLSDNTTYCVTDNGGTQADASTAARSASSSLVTIYADVANDATYFGSDNQFWGNYINMDTASGGPPVINWEYWNGAWSALSFRFQALDDFDEGTGWFLNVFTVPSDWTATTVNSQSAYWIRARATNVAGNDAGRIEQVKYFVDDSDSSRYYWQPSTITVSYSAGIANDLYVDKIAHSGANYDSTPLFSVDNSAGGVVHNLIEWDSDHILARDDKLIVRLDMGGNNAYMESVTQEL